MKETWYVVPVQFALGRSGDAREDEAEEPLLFFHPAAGAAWPDGRRRPRRVKGTEKK